MSSISTVFGSAQIAKAKLSIVITNRVDSGHPCLVPEALVKGSDLWPLNDTWDNGELYKEHREERNLGPKFQGSLGVSFKAKVCLVCLPEHRIGLGPTGDVSLLS